MSSKYPVQPPNRIIKAMSKLRFKNTYKKVVMQNILIINHIKYL